MKYGLFFLFACIAVGNAQAMPMVSLSPSTSILSFNENFTVDVFVRGVELSDPLLAFGFDVSVGAGLFSSSAIVALPFLDDSAFFPTTDVAGSTFPSVSGGDILLSTLLLTSGASAGFFEVSILSSQSDVGFSEGLFTLLDIYGIDERVRVEVVGGATVPLPSTLALILGVAGLLTRRRRMSD